MKTLIIYQEIPELPLYYLIVDGDYSHFNGVTINMGNHPYNKEFSEFMFDDEGNYKYKLSEDISLVQNKEWDIVIRCSFIL